MNRQHIQLIFLFIFSSSAIIHASQNNITTNVDAIIAGVNNEQLVNTLSQNVVNVPSHISGEVSAQLIKNTVTLTSDTKNTFSFFTVENFKNAGTYLKEHKKVTATLALVSVVGGGVLYKKYRNYKINKEEKDLEEKNQENYNAILTNNRGKGNAIVGLFEQMNHQVVTDVKPSAETRSEDIINVGNETKEIVISSEKLVEKRVETKEGVENIHNGWKDTKENSREIAHGAFDEGKECLLNALDSCSNTAGKRSNAIDSCSNTADKLLDALDSRLKNIQNKKK